jgi:alginate O-acetyltransferase complex protein AlgJ
LDFRQGRTTAEVERHLDQAMPARKTLIAAANSVRYLLTRGSDAQVRVGKDEWLFLTDELRFEPAGSRHLAARAELFGAAARALDQQGVKLIVALVPDKARVYADRLSGARYPEYNRLRYQDALNALQLQGVQAVDLLKPLILASAREEVYYRSDTHWNQAGAKVAAESIALAVKGSGIEFEETLFITESAHIPVERPGDLIRLMGLDGSPDTLRPRPDRETPVTTRQEAAVSAGGLFDDAAVQVVLTGTSYSLRGNFHGYVQQALSAKVLNTARDGGGLLQAPTSYLTNDAFHSAKPKVLLWEVPERFLYAKLDGELTWLKKVGLGD